MNMRSILLVPVLAFALGACSPAEEGQPDRLVILDEGSVVTIDPDGANARTIATATDGTFFQPIWSPDRSLLAFSGLEAENQIYVARLDDGEVFSSPTGTFSFYFSWSPQNELAILHNSNLAPELILDTTSLRNESLADLVAVESGQPLYFSWNPNGGAFAAHIGVDRLLTNDLVGSTSLDIDPGAFAAPNWTSRGVLALNSDDPRQTLAFITPDGAATAIASIEGATNFVPNADGSRIAVQGLAEPSQFQSASLQALPTLPSNRLVVVNTDTGEFTRVTAAPAFAFFWSPQGDQLLVLDVVDGPRARWSVWTESGLEELVRFSPDPSFFTDVVPFFDQYAQSVSLWAPDGSAIAFAGTIDGESGIWVQPLDGEPALVHGGTWVSWAP